MLEDSKIRRRSFLAGTTAAAVGVALDSEALAGSSNSLYRLSGADFETLVGESFAVDGTSTTDVPARGTLVLKEVVTCAHPSDRDRPVELRSSGFALRFEGPANLNLAPGTHLLTGAGFPQTGVYLTELSDERTPRQRQFEAVFN